MKKRIWRTKWFLGAACLLLVILLGTAGVRIFAKSAPESFAQMADRVLFTKTIHDFPRHLVDNLDQQEDTNFVVYAKGVSRITASGEVNRLLSINEDGTEYIFANPDEQITHLKRRDVFFMDASEYCVSGFALKVDKVTLENGQAVVRGNAPELSELIEYADVDMDLSMDRIYVEEGEVPLDVSWESPINDEERFDRQDSGESSAALAQMDGSTENAGMSAEGVDMPDSGDTAVDTSDDTAEKNQQSMDVGGPGELLENQSQDLANYEGQTGFVVSTRLEYLMDGLYGSGELGVQFNRVHVTFKYHPWFLTLESGIEADIHPFFEGKFGLKASYTKRLKKCVVYYPVAGPLCLSYGFSPQVSISGSIYGNVALGTNIHAGLKLYGAVPLPALSWPENSYADIDLGEVEGELELGFLGGDLMFGVPKVAEAWVEITGGAIATAKLEHPDGQEENGIIHECSSCVDGDIDWFGRMDMIALSLPQLNETYRGKSSQVEKPKAGWEWNLIDVRGDFPMEYKDFYLSIRDHGYVEPQIEFGGGQCPYKGYPYDVQLTTEMAEGEASLKDFIVKARDENGEEKWKLTDESGLARLFLNGGKYTLTVQHGTYYHEEEIFVDEQKVDPERPQAADDEPEKEILVEMDPPRVFVLLHAEEEGTESFAPIGQVLGNVPYTMIPTNVHVGNDILENELLFHDARPGDIVLAVFYHKPTTNQDSGPGWIGRGFLPGCCDIRIGRLLSLNSGVDKNGEEYNKDIELCWWMVSYNNFFTTNGHLAQGYFHDDLTRANDTPPMYYNLEHRRAATVHYGELPYDAAYVRMQSEQLQSSYSEQSVFIGTLSFMDVYNQVNSYGSYLSDSAALYWPYFSAMQDNRDYRNVQPWSGG